MPTKNKNNMKITGGAVLVTGASSGIGEACALKLNDLGFKVFAGVRKEADGEALQEKSNQRITPVILDVTKEDTIAAARQLVEDNLGNETLVGLVNNAGVVVNGPLEFLAIADLRRQLEINVIGQIAVTQAFLPLLRKAKGRIVNIGSIAGRSSLPFLGPYAASKFALEALTDSLRLEVGPLGVTVSIIEPGAVKTPIWDKSIAETNDFEKNLSQEAIKLYGDGMNAVRKIMLFAAKTAMPTSKVVDSVIHALTSYKPQTRYVVGKDAYMQALLSVLPDRLRDTILKTQL